MSTPDQQQQQQQLLAVKAALENPDGALYNAVVNNTQMTGFTWVDTELRGIAAHATSNAGTGGDLSADDSSGGRPKQDARLVMNWASCTVLPEAAWRPPAAPGDSFRLQPRDCIGSVPELRSVPWLKKWQATEAVKREEQQRKQNERLF